MPKFARAAASAGCGRGYCWAKGVTPPVCPGCGRHRGYHPWSCPVLPRLAAQFLARRVGSAAWRAIVRVWGRGPDPFSPPREFWRRVAAEPDPPDYAAGGWTPDLLPAGGGLRECDDPAGVNWPGQGPAQPVAFPALSAAFGAVPCAVPDYESDTPFPDPAAPAAGEETARHDQPDADTYFLDAY